MKKIILAMVISFATMGMASAATVFSVIGGVNKSSLNDLNINGIQSNAVFGLGLERTTIGSPWTLNMTHIRGNGTKDTTLGGRFYLYKPFRTVRPFLGAGLRIDHNDLKLMSIRADNFGAYVAAGVDVVVIKGFRVGLTARITDRNVKRNDYSLKRVGTPTLLVNVSHAF